MAISRKNTPSPRRPAMSSARRLLRGLAVILVLTAGMIGLFLWWQDRPLRVIEQSLDRAEYDQALDEVNAYLREFPDRSQALEQKARALAGLDRWMEAARLFDAIAADTPAGRRAWSQTLLHLERWSDALPLLKELSLRSPNDPDVLHELVACHSKLGHFEESVRAAERLVKLPGQEQRGRFLLGMVHFKKGNNRLVIQAWLPILERNPDAGDLQVPPADFFEGLGLALLNDGRAAEARPFLEKSVHLQPDSSKRSGLADACEQLGDLPQAVALWREIVADHPDDRAAREGLARAALDDKSVDQARAWLEPLLAGDGLKSSTAYLMQRAALQEGDKPAAATWQERVERLRKSERKMAAFDQALRDAPQAFWSQALLAHRFAREGNTYEALRLAEELLKKQSDPVFQDFVKQLADALRNHQPLPSLDLVPFGQF